VIKGLLAQFEKFIGNFLSFFLIFSSTYQLVIDELRFFLLIQLKLECKAYLWVDLMSSIFKFSFMDDNVLALETFLHVFDNYLLGFFLELFEISS
jgi:hypothetical protein